MLAAVKKLNQCAEKNQRPRVWPPVGCTMRANTDKSAAQDREAYIRELRRQYRDGTLAREISADDPRLDRLLRDVLPELRIPGE